MNSHGYRYLKMVKILSLLILTAPGHFNDNKSTLGCLLADMSVVSHLPTDSGQIFFGS